MSFRILTLFKGVIIGFVLGMGVAFYTASLVIEIFIENPKAKIEVYQMIEKSKEHCHPRLNPYECHLAAMDVTISELPIRQSHVKLYLTTQKEALLADNRVYFSLYPPDIQDELKRRGYAPAE